MCVPSVEDLIPTILMEAHSSKHFIHPRANKMCRDLRKHYC